MKSSIGLILVIALIALFLAMPAFVIYSTQLIKAYKSQDYFEKMALQVQDAGQKISMLNIAAVNRALVKDRWQKLLFIGVGICATIFFFKTIRV